jgi:tetratricopeptide (TPR) repeat protein
LAFGSYPTVREYLRRLIIRRALDPDAAFGTYFGSGVDWASLRRGLAAMKTPQARVDEVKKILEGRPEDPMGRGLLVEALVEAGILDEARAVAARLRREGLAGPAVLSLLCDLEAEAGFEDEARRTCSELVEFNSEDPLARQQLGDLFLRHGWYESAYRQYRTLAESFGQNPIALLRLAAAAAGMGKIDEALRIERKVASQDGEPGPDDPRRWARLHSAVRLASMILEAKAKNEKDKLKSLERSLKRTQAFGASSSFVILVWEDLHADLELVALKDGKPAPLSERIAAGIVGLDMIDLGRAPFKDFRMGVRLGGVPLRRAVPFTVYSITWDGKVFTIEKTAGEVDPGKEELMFEDVV